MSQLSFEAWTPSLIPSVTTAFTSIHATATEGLIKTATSVGAKFSTLDNYLDFISYSRILRGAEASLAIISAQEVIATATDDAIKATESAVIFNNTLNLIDLDKELNLYKYNLNKAANSIYFSIFSIVFLYIVGMIYKSRYHWYNVTYFCGYGLEFAGWLGRILSINNPRDNNIYILQFVALTLAPAFIMAGVYFLFAQIVVIHGRQYSVMKPLWYSYFFITTDVVSLLIQAGGGASASIASNNNKDTRPGSNTIIAGIAFQTFAMTVFLVFYFECLTRVFFRNSKEIQCETPEEEKYKKKSFGNFMKLLFNVKSARAYRVKYLEPFYNQKFAYIRKNPLFGYMPLVITCTVVLIYIRCVYRVVELAEGWRGYLITHEVYVMVLDALMVALAGLLSIPFHPYWVFGKDNVVKLATIKKRLDVDGEDQQQQDDDEKNNESSNSNENDLEQDIDHQMETESETKATETNDFTNNNSK